jgi:hypothetical protein
MLKEQGIPPTGSIIRTGSTSGGALPVMRRSGSEGSNNRGGITKALLWLIVAAGLGLVVAVFLPLGGVTEKASTGGVALEEPSGASDLPEQMEAGDGGEGGKMRFATAAQKRTFEKELFAKVRAIPAAKLEENRDGYARLLELDPQSAYYRKKFEHYSARIREQTRSFQDEILDELARLRPDRGALIQALIARNVVEKTGVPAALPRLWVAPGFYELDFETQQKVVGVVYEYYLAQNPRYDMVLVYDGSTGDKVGVYGEIQGGLNLY